MCRPSKEELVEIHDSRQEYDVSLAGEDRLVNSDKLTKKLAIMQCWDLDKIPASADTLEGQSIAFGESVIEF